MEGDKASEAKDNVVVISGTIISTTVDPEWNGYIGRLAPSPSGHLHIGHAQTFSIARERATLYHGRLLMRIEDIDLQRCKPHYLVDMLEDLTWIGIEWDSGYRSSATNEQNNLFVQSKRLELYRRAWYTLYSKGWIYPCKQSRKDVDAAISAPHDPLPKSLVSMHDTLTVDDRSRHVDIDIQPEPIFPSSLRPEFIQSVSYGACNDISHFPDQYQGLKSPDELRVNWRFRVPDDFKPIKFHDNYCGDQEFIPGKDFGDFLVWRLDGVPAYELAVVVDDLEMGVTEVVRGQDLLLSTARQLLLMNAVYGLDCSDLRQWCTNKLPSSSATDEPDATDRLPAHEGKALSAFKIPQYCHVPLMYDENGVRLAKRNFAKSLRKLREEGYTPDQIKQQYFNKRKRQLSQDYSHYLKG